MKQNKQTPITTSEETLRKIIKEELRGELKAYPTRTELEIILDKKLSNYPTKLDLTFEIEKLRTEVNDKAREYRDEILTKMDHTMGELQNMREENLFQDRDIENLKKAVSL